MIEYKGYKNIYKQDNMQIIHDDCMNILKQTPDNFYDLAVVDCPYGIGMDNSKKRTKPSRPNSYTDYKDLRYHETSWDDDIPTPEYFAELFRVSKNQIIWGANYMCSHLPSGFGWIYWDKMNGDNNNFSDGEFAFSSKGVQSRHFKCSAFDKLRGGKDRIHPTQKPIALYNWIYANYAEPGQKILDTHGGSFSNAIAAHYAKMHFVGCELDEDYYKDAIDRIQKETRQLELF